MLAASLLLLGSGPGSPEGDADGDGQVPLLDEMGKPLPGYDLADCRPASGDSVSEEVHWAAGPDLSALQGKPLRIRLELRDARLFALQFSGRDSGSPAVDPSSSVA